MGASTILVDALYGALAGGAVSSATGGKFLKGAEYGALGGAGYGAFDGLGAAAAAPTAVGAGTTSAQMMAAQDAFAGTELAGEAFAGTELAGGASSVAPAMGAGSSASVAPAMGAGFDSGTADALLGSGVGSGVGAGAGLGGTTLGAGAAGDVYSGVVNPSVASGSAGGSAGGTGIGALSSSAGAASSVPGLVTPAASISAPAISEPVASAAGIPATSAAPIAEQASGLTTEGMLSTQNAFAGQGFENTGLLSKITDALGLSNMSGTTKVGLGMLGFNAYSQAQAKKQAYAFSQQMAALGAPLTAASNQLLQQYESGQLGPNDENTINKFIQDNKAQVKSYYAQSGLGDSSMAQRALESVDIQAASMKDQMRQNMLTSASTLAAQGNAPVMSGIQQQISSDQSLQKSQQDMMASIALLSSMGKKN